MPAPSAFGMAACSCSSIFSRKPVAFVLFLCILTTECKEQQPATFRTHGTVKDAASKFGGGAKKVGGTVAWELGKDTVSGINSKSKEKVTSSLGPEVEQSCSSNSEDESCPTATDLYEEGSRSSSSKQPEESCPVEGESDMDDDLKGSNFELAESGEDDGLFSQLYDIASSGVSTVYQTAKENIYDNGARLIKDFSDAVRSVVSEELYTFLASISSSLGNAFFTPGATLYYLGEKAMTVALVLLTLLLSYLLLSRVSLLFILAMCASVFLLHQVMGPKWIFDWLFYCGYQSSKVLWLMLAHYYISSVVIVLLFAYTVLFPLARRCTQRRPEQQLNDLEMVVLDISERMREMERRQTEALTEIGQRQLEIINILRRLDPNKEED